MWAWWCAPLEIWNVASLSFFSVLLSRAKPRALRITHSLQWVTTAVMSASWETFRGQSAVPLLNRYHFVTNHDQPSPAKAVRKSSSIYSLFNGLKRLVYIFLTSGVADKQFLSSFLKGLRRCNNTTTSGCADHWLLCILCLSCYSLHLMNQKAWFNKFKPQYSCAVCSIILL